MNRTRASARDEIVEAIWSDEPPERVDAALSALLSKLRRIFGADAFEGRRALRLVLPATAWVDVEVLAARGEIAEATLLFDRLRQRLREDLGLAPGPETTAVYERVLRGAADVPFAER